MRLKLAPRQAMSASIAAHLSKCARASFMSLPPGPPLTPHTLAPSRTHPGPRAGPLTPHVCISAFCLCACVFACLCVCGAYVVVIDETDTDERFQT